MKREMIIKRLTVDAVERNIKSIADLLFLCFSNTYMMCDESNLVEKKIASLKSHIQDGTAHVVAAFDGEELIGFVWTYPVSTPFETVLHIAYIAVLEKGQGMGVGFQLLLAVQGIAKKLGLKSIELIVGKDNENAKRFYYNSDFYEDRIILRKELIR